MIWGAVDHPQTIGAAISTGLAEACADPATRALAGALALLAPDPVPEWLFSKPPVLVQRWRDQTIDGDTQEVATHLAALTDPLVLDAAVASLGRHGLVSRRPGGLRMHQLVQDVANAIVNQPALRPRYEVAVGLVVAAVARDDVRRSANTLTPHIAAAVQVADRADANTLVTSYLMSWLGNRHYEYGDLTAATGYLQALLTWPRSSHARLRLSDRDLGGADGSGARPGQHARSVLGESLVPDAAPH